MGPVLGHKGCLRGAARRWSRLRVLGTLAAALLVTAGCSTGPTGPSQDSGGAGWSLSPSVDPLVLTVDGSLTDFTSVPPDSDIDASLATLAEAVDSGLSLGTGLSVSAEIDGSKGGSLQVGRFTLTVPEGAYDGTATITCNLPDSTMMLCDLEISAGTPNQFRIPVVLSLSTQDLAVDAGSLSLFWYDPSVDGWRSMPTTVDSKQSCVSVALTHFSRYCGGKAGW